MPSKPEYLAPIYVIWARAAEVRRRWSQQTRANRRRRANVLLRRIGLDESLLPPVAAHYRPGDRRYRPGETIDNESPFAHDEPPPGNEGPAPKIASLRARRHARKNPT